MHGGKGTCAHVGCPAPRGRGTPATETRATPRSLPPPLQTYLRSLNSFMPSATGVDPVDVYVNGAKASGSGVGGCAGRVAG